MSGFDRLSGALQYQIVNNLGWSSLRPVQEDSIAAILDGDNCVILAPTAGGKTEAAFFPLLSAMDEGDWRPVSVVYLSPIRALINNQADRVADYAGLIGRYKGSLERIGFGPHLQAIFHDNAQGLLEKIGAI